MPTYTTVLSVVCPHVVTVRLPPSGVVSPRNSLYTRRAPGENVIMPAAHEPDVYMPRLPAAAVARLETLPAGPNREVTVRSPRQMGCVAGVAGVAVPLRAADALRLSVLDADCEPANCGFAVPLCRPVLPTVGCSFASGGAALDAETLSGLRDASGRLEQPCHRHAYFA